MKRIPFAAAAFLAAPAGACAGQASDLVKFFYVPEVRFEADAAYRDRFTRPVTKLFELNDEAVRKNPDQIACIDFDPGLDAQDFDQATVTKTLKLREALNGDEGTVTATFDLFPDAEQGAGREMIWSVKKIDGKWKVADIASKTSDWTLSQLECVSGQGAE